MSSTTDVTMLVQYSATDAAIAGLGERFNHLEIEPGDTKSYEIVRLAIAETRAVRVGVEKERKTLKENALEYGRRVDAEAKRIALELREIEDSLKEKKAVVDDEKRQIKEEAEKKERERVERIKGMISDIAWRGEGLMNAGAEVIQENLELARAVAIRAEVFCEFTKEAEETKARVLETLEKQLRERLQFDEERTRVAEERKQLEKQQAEQERKVVAERKQAEEERRRVETERKVAQEKIDAANKKIAEEKAALDRERFKLQAEKEAKENALREEKEREEKKAAAKLVAEIKAKQEAERAPDKEKMRVYYDDVTESVAKSPIIKDKDLRESMKSAKVDMVCCIRTARDDIEDSNETTQAQAH